MPLFPKLHGVREVNIFCFCVTEEIASPQGIATYQFNTDLEECVRIT